MHALVTGATGLVGAHLCERLVADGWSVRALVRDEGAARWLGDAGVSIVPGDILDADAFARAARGVDVVFHAAAAITPPGGWEAFRGPNIDGTANAIAAAAAAGARLLQVSSVAVYGARDGAARDAAAVDEDAPLGALRADEWYARSKRESEALAMAAHAAGRVWATAVRPCVVYGRRDRQFVPRIARGLGARIAPLPRRGRAVLPIVHAANVADAAVRAATCDLAAGRAYNVANDFPLTLREFVRVAAEGLGHSVYAVPLPGTLLHAGLLAARALVRRRGVRNVLTIARTSVDFLGRDNPFTSRRAYEELGWAPPVRPTDGVRDAFAWHARSVRSAGDAAHR